jgi:hypothetical protein
MKRRTNLTYAIQCAMDDLPDGFYLVRVERVEYRLSRNAVDLCFSVVEPAEYTGRSITGRLALLEGKHPWKLGWFLQEFKYDRARSEDNPEKALVGLEGVVKIRNTRMRGMARIRLEAFARASQWEKYSSVCGSDKPAETKAAP